MYATSPDRYSFIIDNYKKRLESNPDDDNLIAGINFYKEAKEKDASVINKNIDLEKDLRSSDYFVKKCKSSKIYSQNLYAALCNNEFIKNEEVFGVSWRHAGGIVANLREEGDYIDWYCSGLIGANGLAILEDKPVEAIDGYVNEGIVTLEVSQDIHTLGWRIKKNDK